MICFSNRRMKHGECWKYLENSVTFLKPSSTEIDFEATKYWSEYYKIINKEPTITE